MVTLMFQKSLIDQTKNEMSEEVRSDHSVKSSNCFEGATWRRIARRYRSCSGATGKVTRHESRSASRLYNTRLRVRRRQVSRGRHQSRVVVHRGKGQNLHAPRTPAESHDRGRSRAVDRSGYSRFQSL